MLEENEQIKQRKQKLCEWRDKGNAYPNDYRRDALAADLHRQYDELDKETIEAAAVNVAIAGRLMSKRVQGKVSFAHVQDMSGRIQLFVQRDNLPEGFYNAEFKKFDVGDVVGAKGQVFKTKTGELSIRVRQIQLLAKALRPFPEKYHGLADQETRYRQRYVDLIVTEQTRETFRIRSQAIEYMRRFFIERDYLEIESPMMLSIPGGAAAKPFITYHHAFGVDLYLRIAQELFLKRVMVGGFEKVFELNRVFRNEGVSTRHNPEFTMLEYNEAYVDYNDYMDLTEELLRGLVIHIHGEPKLTYQGQAIDFEKPFERVTLFDAIVGHNEDITADALNELSSAKAIAGKYDVESEGKSLGEVWLALFEQTVEDKLIQPTYVTGYPFEVSPLSRRNDENPTITDRFELFVAGRELVNGFSEVNDPEYQAEQFRRQVESKAAGDDEAMHYDSDYIRALEYGLPPNAGGGIGVDRLIMLLTDSASIRDVLLFPYMRPEQREQSANS